MKKTLSLFIILNCIQLFTFSQNKRATDSLQKQYKICSIDTEKVNILIALAGEYLEGNTDSVMVYGNKALVLSQKINFKLGIAKSYRRIGIAHRIKSDYTKALDYFNKALLINKELGLQNRVKDEYYNIGRCYRAQEMYAKAIEAYDAALTLSKQMHYDKDIAECLIQIGGIYSNQDAKAQALENYQEALSITYRLKDTGFIAITLIRTGNLYSSMHNVKLALDYFNKATVLYEKTKDKDGIRIAYNCIGLMYQNNSQVSNALLYHQKCLSLSIELGDYTWVRGCLGNIGNIYSTQGNYSKALEYHFKALKIAKELDNSVDWSYYCLARDYFGQKNYKLAKSFMDTASIVNKKHDNLNSDFELLASQIDSARGDGTAAYNHYKQYIILRDKSKSDEVLKAAAKEKFQNEYERKKANDRAEQIKKDIILKEEAEKQKIVRNSFIGGFILVLVIAVIVFRNYRNKQRSNEELARKNHEIQEKQKEIIDSITYAKRIQTSLLPTEKYLERILNKPDKKNT